jgi:hypothetical protein
MLCSHALINMWLILHTTILQAHHQPFLPLQWCAGPMALICGLM